VALRAGLPGVTGRPGAPEERHPPYLAGAHPPYPAGAHLATWLATVSA
jgi:hypothetical protein